MIPEEERKLIYLAGIIDGEGTLGIYKHGERYKLNMAVPNTNRELISWLEKNFGGGISDYKRRNYKHAKTWKWGKFESRAIYKLCKAILPFLIVKREVCELVIEAYEDTFKWEYTGGGGETVPMYARNKREEYYQRTLKLNHTGPKEESSILEPILKKRTITLEEYE